MCFVAGDKIKIRRVVGDDYIVNIDPSEGLSRKGVFSGWKISKGGENPNAALNCDCIITSAQIDGQIYI